MTEKSIWHIVKDCAKGIGMPKLAPHDLRRTCARLCHAAGGELEQIQFLLGHVSRFKQPSDTLAASSGFGRRSMIASESNQIPESRGSGRVADNPLRAVNNGFAQRLFLPTSCLPYNNSARIAKRRRREIFRGIPPPLLPGQYHVLIRQDSFHPVSPEDDTPDKPAGRKPAPYRGSSGDRQREIAQEMGMLL
jgi:hypothetical protein